MHDPIEVIYQTAESPIMYAKFTEMLDPGGEAVATLQAIDQDGNWVETEVRRYVKDLLHKCCYLTDEIGEVRFNNELGQLETVGTWGLMRVGKNGSEIVAGTTGTMTIWEGTGALAATSHTVTVSHDWIDAIGNIPASTESTFKYFPSHQKWRVIDFDCPP